MFLISKLLTSFFLPPGLIIALIAAAIFIRNRHVSRIILIAAMLILYGLSIKPVDEALLIPLEDSVGVMHSIPKNAHAIIVLGGGNYQYPSTSPSPDSAKRVDEAVRIRRFVMLPIILSGGKSPYHNAASDSKAMSKQLALFGITHMVYSENKSLNTYQNAVYTAILLKKLQIAQPVILVTSAYHMERSVLSFKKAGIRVIPDPVDFHTDRRKFTLYNLLPSMGHLANSFRAIHEYIGLLYYSFK